MLPSFHYQSGDRTDLLLQRSFFVCLTLYVWILPIGRTIAFRNVLMALLVINGVWQFVRKREAFKFPLRTPWLIYGALIVFSLFTAVDRSYSLNEMKVEYLYPLILFLLVVNYCRTVDCFYRFIWVIVIGNVFLVSYSLYLTMAPNVEREAFAGSLNSGVGTYSTYLITVMPLLALLAWQQWVKKEISKTRLVVD